MKNTVVCFLRFSGSFPSTFTWTPPLVLCLPHTPPLLPHSGPCLLSQDPAAGSPWLMVSRVRGLPPCPFRGSHAPRTLLPAGAPPPPYPSCDPQTAGRASKETCGLCRVSRPSSVLRPLPSSEMRTQLVQPLGELGVYYYLHRFHVCGKMSS